MDGPQAPIHGPLRTAGVSSVPGSDSSDGRRQYLGDVALVFVTYNSAAVLDPLLDSIAASTIDRISQVVVVDNASVDASIELTRLRLPTATIISNPNNLGFARAVNRGVKVTSSEFVLLANPDVKWSDGTISRLTRFLAEHPRAAAVCPRLVFPNGGEQPSVRRFPTHSNLWLSRQSPLRSLRHILPKSLAHTIPDPPIPSRVEAVAGTCMLIRRGAFDAVGGLDEEYFLYVEDIDLCKRWHDMGYEVWLEPAIAVIHDWAGGSATRRSLRKYHYDGFRRYFHIHHANKRIRNAILSVVFDFAGWWNRFRTVHEEGRDA